MVAQLTTETCPKLVAALFEIQRCAATSFGEFPWTVD